MAKVTVAPGRTIYINGSSFGPGAVFELSDDRLADYVANGLVIEAVTEADAAELHQIIKAATPKGRKPARAMK